MRLVVTLVALASVSAWAQAWVEDCGLEPPGMGRAIPVPRKPHEAIAKAKGPTALRVAGEVRALGWPAPTVLTKGALTGKTVYLSPGHGFTWTQLPSGFEWRTQRPNTHHLVEDLVSAETVDQLLLPMLVNAGAEVITVREADLNPGLVVIDDGEAGYTESGPAVFQDSTLPGWGRPSLPMDGATLPFSLGANRLMAAASTPTSRATYAASLGTDGFYHVAVSYSAFSARVTDAHYVVRHAGGATHFRVDQRRHGGTWVFLGRFFFRAGIQAQVEVLNDSASGVGNVSLDAVRFGGGMGLTSRGASGPSGRPRFEESARYHAQFSGAPSSVWAPSSNAPANDRTNDVAARSRFAAWLNEPADDAVYVAWHTNASASATAVGTTTYVYGPNAPDGTYQFSGVAGSDRLAQLVHGELVSDLRASSGWNQPAWRDRGIDSASFGELNPAHNPEMPAVLLEVAFHDALADAAHLKEPGFRLVAARAITQGIIKYFAEKDGVMPRLPPEAPTHLSARCLEAGRAVVRWRPGATDAEGVRGDPPTSFRLFTSRDGLAWDDGVVLPASPATVPVPVDRAVFFRVSAVNDGGESLPSTVVGVRSPVEGTPRVLVVNGYDRLEAAVAPFESFAPRFDLGDVLRVLLLRMNDGSSVRLHGEALVDGELAFDSADADAFGAGELDDSAYGLIDWVAGRGHPRGAAPTPDEEARLRSFRQRAPLLFSGTALDSPSLLADLLAASLSPRAGSRVVLGAGVLAGLDTELDDGSKGSYDVGRSPALQVLAGGQALATYDTGEVAAVGVEGRAAFLAFPFEGLTSRVERAEVLRRLLAFLALGPPSDGGFPDAGPRGRDAGEDAHDAGIADGGGPHGGAPDAGTLRVSGATVGCSAGAACPSRLSLLGAFVLLLVRRQLLLVRRQREAYVPQGLRLRKRVDLGRCRT